MHTWMECKACVGCVSYGVEPFSAAYMQLRLSPTREVSQLHIGMNPSSLDLCSCAFDALSYSLTMC